MSESNVPEWVRRSCSIVDAVLAECANREAVSASVVMDFMLDLRILLATITQEEKQPL